MVKPLTNKVGIDWHDIDKQITPVYILKFWSTKESTLVQAIDESEWWSN